MKGKVYLLIEKGPRNQLRVTSHRMSRPDQGAAPGLWLALDLEVPDSAFLPYQAAIMLPEADLRGLTIVVPREGVDDPGEEE